LNGKYSKTGYNFENFIRVEKKTDLKKKTRTPDKTENPQI